MKRWIMNGLVLLLTAAVLVAGFFSMDIVKALLPSEQGKIKAVAEAEKTPLLYVDTQEELTFYPWTLYKEQDTVSITEAFQDEKEGNEVFMKKKLERLNARLSEACSLLSPAYTPHKENDFSTRLRYQASVDKFYLPHALYVNEDGLSYYLDLVWDNERIEALHITFAAEPMPLSNDERIRATNELEKKIQANRRRFKEGDNGVKQNAGTMFSQDDDRDNQDDITETHTPVPPAETETAWLDEFWNYHIAITSLFNPDMDEEIPSYLLYEAPYHMVFYEGEILLFFLPEPKDIHIGLLLYVDPLDFRFNGFQLLPLDE